MKAHGAHGVYQYYAGGGGSGSGANNSANYVTFAADATLTADKVLTAGTNVIIRTDAGAIYIDADTGGAVAAIVYAATGAYYVLSQTDGSLPNYKVITASNNVTVTTGASQVYIQALTAPWGVFATASGYFLTSQTDPTLTNEKVIAGSNNVVTRTDAGTFYISCLTAPWAVFASSGGYFLTSQTDPTLPNEKVIAGSNNIITRTDAGTFYISCLTSNVIYAPTGGNYIAFAADANLSSEKVLTASNNIVLRTDANAVYIEATTGSGSSYSTNVQDKLFTWYGAGNLSTAMLVEGARYYIPFNFEIQDCRLAVTTSATGASVIVDVNEYASPGGAGTSYFTTAPSIPALGFTGVGTDFAVTTLHAGSYIGIDVDQVGSTVAGSNLTVTLIARTS